MESDAGMRVLHVHSGNMYGGVETLLTTLARHRGLCAGIEPRFALCFQGRLSRTLEVEDATVYPLGNVRVSRPASIWRARRELRRQLDSGVDVVICHSPWAQALFGPVARAAKVPLVFWLHDLPKGRHWVERWAGRVRPDGVICNSRFTQDALPRLYPGVRSEVLHYPVAGSTAAGERAVVRAELGTSADATVIIQVSRMEAWKGHALHLEALGRLKELPGWECWQVGGAQRPHEVEYLESLHATAARLGIAERVRFLGDRTDVTRLLTAADIHCQPNVEPEPFGITFVEALYAGLPVVSTRMGGAAEIVDSSCGLLVEPGDAATLAAGLRGLLDSPSLRERLGEGGPARARELCDPAAQLHRLHHALHAFSVPGPRPAVVAA